MDSFLVPCGDRKLVIDGRTLIMGVVNVTPDSFSDGGKFFSVSQAVSYAEILVECGADIIDIGGESSRPFAKNVSVDEEARRVLPVIEALSKLISVPISIDTTKADIATRAVNAGASIVNDISALAFDPKMAEVVAQYGVGLILMHMRGVPENMQLNLSYDDLINEIKSFLSQSVYKAVKAGVKRDSIIIDPGIGFGKSTDDNLQIINKLDEFSTLGLPILIGSSRKTFIRKVLGKGTDYGVKVMPDILEIGTQATLAVAAMRNANIVRVHNVANARATLDIINAIRDI